MLSILSLILWLIMIDTSSYPWTNLLQDSNFLVSKSLNTSEFRVYLITKILIYMSPRSHFRGPGSHLVILRSWVRMALFRYALIYNCSVVDKGYQKNLKNQVYHISSIYKYYYARKTTFRGNSEKTKTKTKKKQRAVILLSRAARLQSLWGSRTQEQPWKYQKWWYSISNMPFVVKHTFS